MPRGQSKERSFRPTCRRNSLPSRTPNGTPNFSSAKPLHSILVGSSSSSSSTSSSRSVSGSSTNGSYSTLPGLVSGKCVHFPCAPDKLNHVAYTHSRELYDRSPILPSAGAASLDIPSCRNDEEQGSWIQCLQRKVKEAVDEGFPAPHTKPAEGSTPEHNTVSHFSPAYESSSGTSCSDTDELVTPLSCSPPFSTPSFSPEPQEIKQVFLHDSTEWSSVEMVQSEVPAAMVDAGVEEEVDSECDTASSEDESALSHPDSASRRPGMCSLGKFSRSSLFECDAFGGCAFSSLYNLARLGGLSLIVFVQFDPTLLHEHLFSAL